MTIHKVVAELKKARKIAILTHHNADLDSVCPALVLKEVLQNQGKEAMVGAAESVSKGARRMIEGHDVKIDPDVSAYDLVVTIDCASPEQLLPIKLDYTKLVVIDHHQPGALAEKAVAAYVDSTSRSCTQIVYKIVKEFDVKLTPDMAKLLIAGIVGDTAYLRFADIEIFEILIELLKISGKKYHEILDLLGSETDVSERIAILKSAKRIHAYSVGDVLVVFSTVGSFEASVARSFLKLGSDIAIVAVPRDGAVRISGRMNWTLRPKLNLATEIFKPCEAFIGGSAGGHDAAASANGTKPENIKRTFEEMLKLLEKKLGAKAKEI
ncbi:MAG: DHH family phosphoesterase [Candidatus Aenigmatarchaeota archaeon]|nr:MAG: DHH family phosphoesterase [Candidatus Aenigmarchaeota archaeon]